MPVLTLGLLSIEVAVSHRTGGFGSRSFEFMVQPVLVAALIVQWMAFSHSTAGWRWLNWGWLVYLGKISYSTYLYQQLTPSVIKPVTSLLPSMVPQIVANIPAIVFSASASYFLIEKPFLTLKDRFGQRQPSGPPASEATPPGGSREGSERVA